VAGLILPLDHPSAEEALELVDLLGETADFYKVGLELYTTAGPDVVRTLRERGKRVFLDLKLHDIPNTVRRAVQAAVKLDVEFLTVHASGGASMLRAARDAADGRVRLLGVTVLTSLTGAEVEEVWGREIRSIRDEVARLAELSVESGVDGVVCSVLEAEWLRRIVPPGFVIVTPGIRPAGADRQDQSRVATPADAVASGSDFLVVGRPVTRASDPRAALSALLAEISSAQGS
jgi:orotidine-5'-phosphate decarboxylase